MYCRISKRSYTSLLITEFYITEKKVINGLSIFETYSFVENHASQCGFCTPGFVMSLYAGWCKNRNLDNAAIDDLFAGNLCRCTGYRPIKQGAFHTNDISVKERDTLFRDEEEKFIILVSPLYKNIINKRNAV